MKDCTGREARVGDQFTYPTRRGSNIHMNQYVIDEIQEPDIVKATIIGGDQFKWRSKRYDRKSGEFVEHAPRQSTILCFDHRATIYEGGSQ
jgi:hypothetical protein